MQLAGYGDEKSKDFYLQDQQRRSPSWGDRSTAITGSARYYLRGERTTATAKHVRKLSLPKPAGSLDAQTAASLEEVVRWTGDPQILLRRQIGQISTNADERT